MIFKIRKFPLAVKSFLITLLFIPLFTLINISFSLESIYKQMFIILFSIIFFILIYLLLIFITSFIEYKIDDKKIIRIFSFLKYRKEKIIYYDKDEITYEINHNLFLSFGYEFRLKIYSYHKKILSLVVKNDDINDLALYFKELKPGKKEPYKKNRQYFNNYRSIISLAFNNSVSFLYVFLFALFFASLLKKYYNRLLIISIFLVLSVFLLYLFYLVISTKSNDIQFMEKYVIIKKGIIFKRNLKIPNNMIDNFNIKTNILEKIFDSYIIKIKIGRFNNVYINVHRDNISFFTKINLLNFERKTSPYYFIIIASILLSIFIGIFISKISINASILFIMISIIIVLFLFMNSLTIINDEYIIFLNSFILIRGRFISLKEVKRIKEYKLLNIFLLKIDIDNYSYYRIINKKELDDLKIKLSNNKGAV